MRTTRIQLLSSHAVQPEASGTVEPQGPRVAAIVVAHNQREPLARCLRALEASSIRSEMEVIVIDGGSSDGSGRVDEEFEGITVLRLPRNFGRSRARNIGARTAKADLLLFVDTRVELSPGAVGAMAAAVEADDNAAAAVPVFRTRDGAELSSGRGLPDSSALKRASLNDERLPGGNSTEAFEDWAFLVRRPVLKGMNGFDEKRFSEHWAELEVCWQIRNAGKSIIRATGAEAVLHEPAGGEQDETLLAADRVSGAAGYVGKHEGLVAGLLFRLSCAFSALFSGRIGLFSSILSGNRVDPT